ncbi:hypothetical protein ASG87_18865 [Frateuria sp. Soil773]|uniref:type I polyketide synthase n=1 Tax=Frateuria sp. Soil773 TaxID=1736407 RepID=UPI0006FB798F|nr:type I polyketide synthase [Frateuria sp. Soil773]KRE90069.1 hypothetical protein ASG87_18865 [Frateuria sp. Soil773]
MSDRDSEAVEALLLESLEAIERLEKQLLTARNAQCMSVAIVGMACQFPGGEDLESFWRLLLGAGDAIGPIPKDRFDAGAMSADRLRVREGGFVGNLREFDADFFGISPREAKSLDPQQRLLLEVVWQTLEHAGKSASELRDSRTGVFVGLCSNDYQQMLARQRLEQIDAYLSSGTCHSTASGRISYWLGLKGPSVAIDTACSSSLVAMHLARLSIQGGNCDQALVGGVNRIVLPQVHINFQQAGMLAPDGRCKAFSAQADGFGRSEGCGIVMLKRLDHAVRDGDRILAVLAGSACNQDGRSAGLTVPNGPSQSELVRLALNDAGLSVHDIDYVEAHGTGTRLGDPIELNSLGEVFAGRDPAMPLPIGSVKTNIGHLEAAAGIASVIKVLLALQHDLLPAQRFANDLTPEVDWQSLPVRPLNQARPWARSGRPRVAGISSFGFSGTNAHVLLAEAPLRDGGEPPVVTSDLLLPISARDEAGLAAMIGHHAAALDKLDCEDAVRHYCMAAATRRDSMPWRLCASAQDATGLREALAAAKLPTARSKSAPRVAFLFTGQGSLHAHMADGLLAADPAFAIHLGALCMLARPHCDEDLFALLQHDRASRLSDTRYAQPALLALQLALLRRLRELGIEPVACLGHSVGEIAAMVAAGILDEASAMRFACQRGQIMSRGMPPGGMVAVFCRESELEGWLSVAPGLALAACNAVDVQVIAGPAGSVEALLASLTEAGQAHAALRNRHAFHTAAVDALLPELDEATSSLALQKAHCQFVSSQDGESHSQIDRAYLLRQCREPVQFSSALRTLAAASIDVCVELGAGKSLLGLVRRMLPHAALLPTGSGAERPQERLLPATLAALWQLGAMLRWQAWFGGRGPVMALPSYAFQRQRYWLDETEAAAMAPGIPDFAECLARAGIKDVDSTGRALLRRFHAALRGERWLPGGLLYQLAWQPEAAFDLLPPTAVPEAPSPAQTESLCLYQAYERDLERLAADYVRAMWFAANLHCQVQDLQSVTKLLRVLPRLKPLVPRLLAMLEQAGYLVQRHGSFETTEQARGAAPLEECIEAFQARHGRRVEFRLLHRCGLELGAVLAGMRNPVHLLFPDNSFDDVTELYRDGPVLNALSQSMCEWLETLLAACPPGQGLRILEIGGGTGGTTAHVLPRLVGRDAKYCFTDVGPAFVTRAHRQFGHLQGFSALTFDLESDVDGFVAGGANDLVIAANVVHATRDIERSLRRAASQLKPGGWLALVEGTEQQAWVDLTFGLTDGWWCFDHDPLRADYPLLGISAWRQLLTRIGFDAVQVVDGHPGSSQKLVLARYAGLAKQSPARLRHVLIGADAILRQRLRDALIRLGAEASDLIDAPDGLGPLAETVMTGMTPVRMHVLAGPYTTDLLSTCMRLAELLSWPQRHVDARLRVWIATEKGIAGSVGQGLLAFARVASLESGQHGIARVLFDPDDGDSLCRAAQELELPSAARECHWSAAGRKLPRLLPMDANASTIPVLSDAQYLVTGGLGGVGLVVLRWLADQGVRHIRVFSRTGIETAVQRDLVAELRARQVRVVVDVLDLADAGAVASAFETIAKDPAPLRGILHLAGVITEPMSAGDLRRADFERVFAAKVFGTANLDRQSRALPLDFFLCFSSGASAWGFKGQAHYAAANGYIDGLIAERRSLGLSGTSINWGHLRPGGMAAGEESRAVLAGYGVQAIDSEEIVEVLAVATRDDPGGMVVARNDWPRLQALMASAGEGALLAHLVGRTAPVDTSAGMVPEAPMPAAWRARLSGLSMRKQEALVEATVMPLLASVLNVSDIRHLSMDDGFQAMGVDSLMALEFRQRIEREFQLNLPATMIYDWPSPVSLVRHLLDMLRKEACGVDAHDSPETCLAGLAAERQVGSDVLLLDELEASLERELRNLPDLAGEQR